ncbi:hypothetical protein TELCIR_16950, partial [Teladorsagia circumcincta]
MPEVKSDDEWETEVVVVEVNGVLDARSIRQAIAAKQTTLRRPETETPLLQIGNSLFTGKWLRTVGTDIILQADGGQHLKVDMEVSSGDESDVELRPSQDLQSKYEEKKRIEEKIQALMKDFERKRLEEKARKACEAAAAASLESTLTNVVSTTSEVPTAAGKPSEQNSMIRSSGHIIRGPSTPADSPVLTETGCDLPHSSSVEQPRSEECEKEGMDCELPSSSVEVPPVPTYEEIEECIYRVDNKKKAMSLMCFCRGNNLDCSDSRCDNRAMFTECPKNCLGKGKDCGNRRFSKREYAAVQAFYTGPNKGFGVQAVAPIK